MENEGTNLIVNYLPQNFTDRDLYCLFLTIGKIDSYRVMKDFKTGYSYGFGFVNFVSPIDAKKAIDQLNGLEVFNKRIKVGYARPSSEQIKDTNVYVTELPRNYTADDLENLFGKFGTIVQKNLLTDKVTGNPRGVAFVRFDKREEAQRAIKELDGIKLPGGIAPISVRLAEEHGKQKAAYYAGLQCGLEAASQMRQGRRPKSAALNPVLTANPARMNAFSGRGRGHFTGSALPYKPRRGNFTRFRMPYKQRPGNFTGGPMPNVPSRGNFTQFDMPYYQLADNVTASGSGPRPGNFPGPAMPIEPWLNN